MSMAITDSRWDCHAHLFGPYERFPLAQERSYTPPEAVEFQYMALLRRMGMTNGVLVHPSAYGDDHSLLLHALAAQPSLRGVVVVRPDSPLPLKGLRDQGVRAARFSHRSGPGTNFSGSASIHDLQNLSVSLAHENLHAELWTDCAALPDIAPMLLSLPVPVVIDHMGGFDPDKGLDDPGFRTLLKLLDTGKVWIKLCAYRNLLAQSSWETGRAFMQAMVEARSDRLVWGSDWPHLRVMPQPDTLKLLDMFMEWADSDSVVRKVLGENAQTLYG